MCMCGLRLFVSCPIYSGGCSFLVSGLRVYEEFMSGKGECYES